MLPHIVCMLLKINIRALYAVGMYVCIYIFFFFPPGVSQASETKETFYIEEDFDICDWEEHHIWTLVCWSKGTRELSVTVAFSRKTLLGEVRNKEWKPHDRSFVSEYRLKIMGERRKLYVCLWGGGVQK